MNNRKVLVTSPEKEDRYYTTRGSLGLDDNGKVLLDPVKEDRGVVWPKLFITLSSKEKEEDFMAMKGCKPPQRPKKRAKLIQRSLLVSLLVIPVQNLHFFCYENLAGNKLCDLGVCLCLYFFLYFLAVGQSRCMALGSVPREV